MKGKETYHFYEPTNTSKVLTAVGSSLSLAYQRPMKEMKTQPLDSYNNRDKNEIKEEKTMS